MSRVPGDHETIMRQPRGEYAASEASVHARTLIDIIDSFIQLLTTFRLRSGEHAIYTNRACDETGDGHETIMRQSCDNHVTSTRQARQIMRGT